MAYKSIMYNAEMKQKPEAVVEAYNECCKMSYKELSRRLEDIETALEAKLLLDKDKAKLNDDQLSVLAESAKSIGRIGDAYDVHKQAKWKYERIQKRAEPRSFVH